MNATAHHLTVRDLLDRMKKAGVRGTLLGIGPVSALVIRAAYEVAVEEGAPPIFIASRNQVDSAEFGSGYLLGGTDQKRFVGLLREMAAEAGYRGPIYVCRDHGGPWQRNTELDGRMDVASAMAIAKKSFRADLEAGFNYLHIDPTKCPHAHAADDLIRWTVELVEFCEQARADLGLQPVDYEIGTEDIKGGKTSEQDFEAFVRRVVEELRKRKFPLPTCIVGQTGTLTRMNAQQGRFHAEPTRRLVEIADRYGLGFKEHNADYLADADLDQHPPVGVAGANVAPEFGYVETSSLMAMEEFEIAAVRQGAALAAGPSRLREVFTRLVRETAPWKKWLTDALKGKSAEALFGDATLARTLTGVCGHYVFDQEKAKAARQRLAQNFKALWAVDDPERFVLCRVKESIRRYVRRLNMTGVSGFLK
jgi:tagatose-1,6-bisphosphate aldolase non-catalytic subunit AgaZ/GatZ